MWNGFNVIDADGHMHEPQDLWTRNVEAKYRDQVPKVAFMDGNIMVYEPDGEFIGKGEIQAAPPESARRAMEEKYGEAYRQWWSPAIRLRDMDQFGWDIQVLLPTGNNGNFAYRVALKDLQLGAAMCRAYNNWCHEYCSADPKRLKFVAVLPGSDVGEMVKEARRAVTELGAVSVRNPYLPEGKWLHEPQYDPLWQLACELDFPIACHGENRQRRFQPFRKLEGHRKDDMELALRGLNHALGFPCDNMATLGHFIFTGLLERFPKLRLAILESNAGWLPFWLGRMDDHTHGRNSVMGKSERLCMLPSEYFMRQCTISCDSDERALNFVVSELNGENIVWNTDYPHADAVEPAKALPMFDAQITSADAKRTILWDNAVKLFGPRILS
ncbi:MAG: amidohydrolase [Deltaproteobacteria bacterium]|nr:amidohydrolase [Deltaproteobacteria bacterium]